jgi:hypothetical protein
MERQGAGTQGMKLDGAPSQGEVEAFASLFDGLADASEDSGILWSVSLNRRASTSVWRSRLTVKADAAARLFEARSTGIRWAGARHRDRRRPIRRCAARYEAERSPPQTRRGSAQSGR